MCTCTECYKNTAREGRDVQVRRLHELADFRIQSHNFIQDAAVHIDIVIHEVQGGAVCPRGGRHLDNAVLDQRAALVEARATGDLRVERVAKGSQKIVHCGKRAREIRREKARE